MDSLNNRIDHIVSFIRDKVLTNNKAGVIVGNSGGIDSAVTIGLCCRAMPDKKILTYFLPNEYLKVSEKDRADAQEIAKLFSLPWMNIPIQSIIHQYVKYMPTTMSTENIGNLSARVRANILYSIAFSENLLVVGTSDKSEYEIGFFTKYGDGACDIMPIVGLYKTDLRAVARHLGIPQSIIDKPSAPNLWDGHTAEGEIGLPYTKIDAILKGEISDDSTIQKLRLKSQHKRQLPERP